MKLETSSTQSPPVLPVDVGLHQTSMGTQYTHSIEPDLAFANIPRLSQLTKRTVLNRRLLWNGACLVAGVMIFLGQRTHATWDALIQRGVTTTAVIYDEPRYSENNTASFRFQADGKIAYGELNASGRESHKTRTGATFPITYLPNTEGTIWEAGYISTARRDEAALSLLLSGTLAFGLICCGIALSNRDSDRQLRYLREGIAVHGRVSGGEVNRMGGINAYEVYYTYWVGDGTREGTIRVHQDDYHQWISGNPFFTVLYFAHKPSSSIPYSRITAAYLVAK